LLRSVRNLKYDIIQLHNTGTRYRNLIREELLYIEINTQDMSLFVYADHVNILSGSIHTIRKNTEASVIASKEIGLEVNAEKTKYMVMS
jgi:hypothetical protein